MGGLARTSCCQEEVSDAVSPLVRPKHIWGQRPTESRAQECLAPPEALVQKGKADSLLWTSRAFT